MKKYITVAALLVAGTAFANATSLDDALYSGRGDITNITGISGSFSYTLVFKANVMKAILGNSASSTSRPMLALADNNYDMGLATALNNTGFVGTYNYNSSALTDLTMGGDNSENRQPMIYDGTELKTNNFAASNATGNLTSSLSLLSGLAVTFVHTDKTSSSLYVTLQFSDDTETTLYGTNTGFKWSNGVGALNNLYINETYVSDVYLFDTAVSKEDALRMNAAAIPEPSAFGMLVGLGALALVASRRRRK